MLTDWRPVVYDCLLTTTTWLYPHIASPAKKAKPSCRDAPQVNNKARGRRGTLLSRLVSTCTRIGFTFTVAGHPVTAGHFVCKLTSQVGGLGKVRISCFPKATATWHGRESNPRPPDCESDSLTTLPRCPRTAGFCLKGYSETSPYRPPLYRHSCIPPAFGRLAAI
ncbi:hypothetical protein ElyMa_005402200 [Elysia marginata]|uniref:Uncharacterized protein n=1 Tax=Elysia marginata TaxID=1093978 RepID=A0AAV4EHF0_9GAST|nr:hypothetical protein ElyMa_005402200 [Elysia marginata]